MAKKNITVTELSREIGKDRNTIHNYLNGKTSMKVDDLEKIAEYIGEPVTIFFTSESIDLSAAKNNQIEVYKKLLHEKDERIAELKEQLHFLRNFYEKFSDRDEG